MNVIFLILIQFMFVSKGQGKWVAIERDEILDTYYEHGKNLKNDKKLIRKMLMYIVKC